MKGRALLALLLTLGIASTLAAGTPTKDKFLAALDMARTGVRWDPTTMVSRDFDGDGQADSAVIGYVGHGIVLAVRASSVKAPQFLDFGINASEQAAICAAPAHLKTLELSCDIDGEKLPGCRDSQRAWGLNLSGGECDAINLYWNHDEHHLSWWRR